MSYDQSRSGTYGGARPDAYDPAATPELFEGVLACRMLAFLIDVIIIALPVIAANVFVLLFGFLTFGLGWFLFFPLHGAAVVWAVLYYGFTLGGAHSATIGMRTMGIEMRTSYGAPAYFVLGAVHAIAYWISVAMFTPFILLVGLFNSKSRLLHDFILGTVIVNSPARAAQFTYRR